VNRIARQTYRDEVELVVVSTHHEFVERPRLHQLATGQPRPDLPLSRFLAHGVAARIGRVERIDRAERTLHLADESAELAYDTLVYAAGSTIDLTVVPGAATHAVSVTSPAAARGIAERLGAHPHGRVVVVGGGLTGLELAGEVAESYPQADVTLLTAGDAGDWLSPRARAYVGGAFDDLGVRRLGQTRVLEVQPGRLVTDVGGGPRFDLCLWAGGFAVPRLAADSGLEVDERGRVVTDEHLMSSDDHIYAIGDAAAVPGHWGSALAMGCRTGGFTGPTVADTIVARLAGREAREFHFRYLHECLSLGRRHALVQFLDRDGEPLDRVLRGRAARWYKNAVLDAGRWVGRRPGPYLPRRRRHVQVTTTAAPLRSCVTPARRAG
jgi:NADH dehydrogenase FAD-containing subunit